ncbi:hypothetical protein C9374_007999 [Naegleria lovaniensis]|uniref:Glutathione S-transferase n=1 Tax=Naegleria lovaniensis TaxID=51637 RepID=A0AA88KI40_NAELO|nr:uncharacterized protein C9374_007999 [Naegleria lovaniensis]KAG2378851.1 hypothetical protein C9374_007999 [Naegleria lovaniensis]
MSEFILHYFNIQARAEAAYLIALHGQVPHFERKFITGFAESDLKQQAPFGQVPLLEIVSSKTLLAQSIAICQYLAELGKLLPSQQAANSSENVALLDALALQYVLGVDEFRSEAYRLHRNTTDETKVNDIKTWKEGRMLFFLGKFESFLEQSKKGFLVGNELSWADLVLYDALYEQLFLFGDDFAQKYPALNKLMKHVESLPNLSGYLGDASKRPSPYIPKWRN